jgi:hypothetical protein
VRGPGKNFIKGKSRVQIMTQNSVKNILFKRMAFKGTIALFAFEVYWHNNLKGKKCLCKNYWSSPLNRVVKGLVSQA